MSSGIAANLCHKKNPILLANNHSSYFSLSNISPVSLLTGVTSSPALNPNIIGKSGPSHQIEGYVTS